MISEVEPVEAIDLNDYLRIVRERRWVVIASVVIVVGAALLVSFLTTRSTGSWPGCYGYKAPVDG